MVKLCRKYYLGAVVFLKTRLIYHGRKILSIGGETKREVYSTRKIFQLVKNMCDTGAAISRLIIVRSKNSMNSSARLTGIFEPRINPPTSDR